MRVPVVAVEPEPSLLGDGAVGLALVSVVCVVLLAVIYRLLYPVGSPQVAYLVTFLRHLVGTARGAGTGRSEPPAGRHEAPSRAGAPEPRDREGPR